MRKALLVLSLLAFGFAQAERPAQPEAASGVGAVKEARGRLFMAVTANPLATDAAVEILSAGGTAADAAIAAQLVLNLVEPQSSGLGGGGFLLYHDAHTNKLRAYDGRETAPAAARPERFLGADGQPLPFSRRRWVAARSACRACRRCSIRSTATMAARRGRNCSRRRCA